MGLRVLEGVSKGHIDSQTLAEYAFDPEDFSKEKQTDIEEHLKSCAQCRNDHTTCQVAETPVAEKDSFLKNLFSWFFAPQLGLRPAVGLALIVLLAVPLSYFAVPYLNVDTGVASCKVEAMGGRNHLKTENVFEIAQDDQIARLEFKIHSYDSAMYDFELYNDKNQKLLTKYSNTPEKPFIFDVPVSVLNPGNHILIVREYENGVESGVKFVIPVEFIFTM